MKMSFCEKTGILLEPEGLFDFSNGAKCVKAVEPYLRDYGPIPITVDFRDTAHMDSSGIGALITMMRMLPNHAPAIRLVHPSPSVQKLMEVCHLHQLFEIKPRP